MRLASETGQPAASSSPRTIDVGSLAPRWATIVACTALLLLLDAATGPHVQLGALYAVPVAIAAWTGARALALSLAVAVPLLQLGIAAAAVPAGADSALLATTAFRIVGLVGVAIVVEHFARARRRVELELDLHRHPIQRCVHCMRVRDSRGDWCHVDDRLLFVIGKRLVDSSCGLCSRMTSGRN